MWNKPPRLSFLLRRTPAIFVNIILIFDSLKCPYCCYLCSVFLHGLLFNNNNNSSSYNNNNKGPFTNSERKKNKN